jgi:aspartate-semialdehyde dehydrogenase
VSSSTTPRTFRYDADIPLIVPEVNAHRLADYKNRNIIANPNCSTIQMVVALKPLHDAARITRINVATYQSVSGAGAGGVRELAGQTANLLNGKAIETRQDAEADRLQRACRRSTCSRTTATPRKR